jgi:hypothetical protein
LQRARRPRQPPRHEVDAQPDRRQQRIEVEAGPFERAEQSAQLLRGTHPHRRRFGGPWRTALPFELPRAIAGHYAIGMTLACGCLWANARLDLPARLIGPALGYAACTNLLPWLVMFPALGYGLFGSHGPAGTRLFTGSRLGHGFFGLGF